MVDKNIKCDNEYDWLYVIEQTFQNVNQNSKGIDVQYQMNNEILTTPKNNIQTFDDLNNEDELVSMSKHGGSI